MEAALADRAEVIVTTIFQMVRDAVRAHLAGDAESIENLRTQIRTILRDELDDVARTTRDDVRVDD